jgi:hypothetical protein
MLFGISFVFNRQMVHQLKIYHSSNLLSFVRGLGQQLTQFFFRLECNVKKFEPLAVGKDSVLRTEDKAGIEEGLHGVRTFLSALSAHVFGKL